MNLVVAYVQLGLLDEARALLDYLIIVEEAGIAIRGAASSWACLITDYYVVSAVAYLEGNLDRAIATAKRAVHYVLESGRDEEVFVICSSGLEQSFSGQSLSREKVQMMLAGQCIEILEGDVVHWTYAWQYAVLLGDTFTAIGEEDKALNIMRCALALLEEAFKRSQNGSQDLTAVWPLQWRYPFDACIKLLMSRRASEDALAIAEGARARTFLNLLQAVSLTEQGSWTTPAEIELNVEDALSTLLNDEAILEYYTTDKAVYLWVLTHDSKKSITVPYPEDELLSDIMAMRFALEDPTNAIESQETLKAISKKLYEALVLPAISDLAGDVDRLIVIPSGPLWYLPFAALPMTDQQCEDPSQIYTERTPYLVENYSLAHLPSLASLPLLGDVQTRQVGKPFIGLANPTLSPEQQQEIGTRDYLYEELEKAVGKFAECFVGKETRINTHNEASEECAKSESSDTQVALFACHGKFDPRNPLYSNLYLASGGGEDGNYYAHEVYTTKHTGTELVILAACETLFPALSKEEILTLWKLEELTTGDEVVGLARAFLSSGAEAVLGTLWQANPKAIEKLLVAMCGYYQQESMTWADALCAAQCDLIKDDTFNHPWFWAPYQLIGRWR